MHNTNNVAMIIKCDYTEVPRAIFRCLINGFTLDDIVKTRIGCRTYEVIATREMRKEM